MPHTVLADVPYSIIVCFPKVDAMTGLRTARWCRGLSVYHSTKTAEIAIQILRCVDMERCASDDHVDSSGPVHTAGADFLSVRVPATGVCRRRRSVCAASAAAARDMACSWSTIPSSRTLHAFTRAVANRRILRASGCRECLTLIIALLPSAGSTARLPGHAHSARAVLFITQARTTLPH